MKISPSEGALTLERSCLGAAIVDRSGKQAGMLCAMLREEDFGSGLNRECYRAIRRLIGRGIVPLDYSLIIAELQNASVFEQYANAWSYVSNLGDGIVTACSMVQRIEELKRATAERNRKKLLERELNGR